MPFKYTTQSQCQSKSIKKICVSGMMAEKEWTKKGKIYIKKKKIAFNFPPHTTKRNTAFILFFHHFIIILLVVLSCNMKHTSITTTISWYFINFFLSFAFFCIFYYVWHVKVPLFFIGVFVFVLKDVWWGADDWEKL